MSTRSSKSMVSLPTQEDVDAEEVEVSDSEVKDVEMPSTDSNNDMLKSQETLPEDDDNDDDDVSLSDILQQQEKERAEEEEARERAEFAPPLLMHAYHLPGYNWRQDLQQYLSNNHPVFGIFCHHRYHPIKAGVRLASLIGSVLFGLALTNIIYLAFVFTQTDPDQEYLVFSTNATKTGLQEDLDATVSTLSVTTGNIALWTVGSLLHGFYDNTIWALAACSCLVKKGHKEERMSRYRSMGTFLVTLSVIVVVAIATFACMLRAAMDADQEGGTNSRIVSSHQLVNNEMQEIQTSGGVDFQDYEFVVSYLVELLLSYLIYYPLVGLLLFSGVLNCTGRFPVLGGRPYEIRQRREQELEDNDVEEGVEMEWKDEDDNDEIESTTSSSENADVAGSNQYGSNQYSI